MSNTKTGIDHWRAKLRAIGLHYLGESAIEAEAHYLNAMVEREGLPVCYGRSYRLTDQACARCEAREACSTLYIEPQINLEVVDVQQCEVCDGQLSVELIDENGKVVDYACSSEECNNTLKLQISNKEILLDLSNSTEKAPTGETLKKIRESLGMSCRDFERHIGVNLYNYGKNNKNWEMEQGPLPKRIINAIEMWLKKRT